MKNYYLENVSDGIIILRCGQFTLRINKKSRISITDSAILKFKDQIAKLSKEKNQLKMYPVGTNEVEVDKPKTEAEVLNALKAENAAKAIDEVKRIEALRVVEKVKLIEENKRLEALEVAKVDKEAVNKVLEDKVKVEKEAKKKIAAAAKKAAKLTKEGPSKEDSSNETINEIEKK